MDRGATYAHRGCNFVFYEPINRNITSLFRTKNISRIFIYLLFQFLLTIHILVDNLVVASFKFFICIAKLNQSKAIPLVNNYLLLNNSNLLSST